MQFLILASLMARSLLNFIPYCFQISFIFIPCGFLDYSLCDTHYVDIFKGSNANGSPFKSLCGYIGSSEVVSRDKGKHLTLEFV